MKEKIPLFLLSVGSCVGTALVPGLLVPQRVPIIERTGNALVSYVVYLRQVVLPTGLALLYPAAPNDQTWRRAGLALILLAAITVVVMLASKKRPCLLTGWFWYLGMLFPVIGIIQISHRCSPCRPVHLSAGNRIGHCWDVGCGGLDGGVEAPSGGFGLSDDGDSGRIDLVWPQPDVGTWRNGQTLWTRSLACTSANSIAYCNLGDALSDKGEENEAIAQYGKALEITPGLLRAHYNLGTILARKGEKEKAIMQFREALEINPNDAEVHNNLGAALFEMGGREEAIAQYRAALQIKPEYRDALKNLGTALFEKGEREEAIAQYRKALQIKPDDADACNKLGTALCQKGDLDGAIAQDPESSGDQPRL